MSDNTITLEQIVLHVSAVIEKITGNLLRGRQKEMVVSRLQRRISELKINTPGDYWTFYKANQEEENQSLISLLTTHHTFFFREFSHFEFLEKNILSIIERVKKRGENKIKIYSAACSRGQEVYSLAMFFSNILAQHDSKMDFSVLGTDIDSESIQFCKNGIYLFKEISSIPRMYLGSNWARGTGDIADYAKVKPNLKQFCQFELRNLIDFNVESVQQKFDIIFCRNVFIYFDEDVINNVTTKLTKLLHPEGIFITGVTEPINHQKLNLERLGGSIYTIPNLSKSIINPSSNISTIAQIPILNTSSSLSNKKLRVLITDDSPSICKILTLMFKDDPDFEVAGVASNGEEAEKFLKINKVDLMTLDIHMPVMDGITYLKKNFSPTHPKVVMISSASREDATYAQEALKCGAFDFVEKPNLKNFTQQASEIKSKLKAAYNSKASVLSSSFDDSFRREFKIPNPEKKIRIFCYKERDTFKVAQVLKELKGDQPPTLSIVDTDELGLIEISKKISSSGIKPLEVLNLISSNLKTNQHYFIIYSKNNLESVKSILINKKKLINIFGVCSKELEDSILELRDSILFLEDVLPLNSQLKDVADEVFPYTSFAHIGTEKLAKE